MSDAIKITPEIGKRMLAWALKYLAEKRGEINAINVFPVKDKDTGNNMLSGLRGAFRRVKSKSYGNDEKSIVSFYADFEKGLLRSAQGNAGVISAAYLQKFFKEIFNSETCSAGTLLRAFDAGMAAAFRSVQNPVEGTMLDVIKAAYMSAQLVPSEDLLGTFDAAVSGAAEELPKTKERMAILKNANVVDAGAMGFVVMLAGLRDGFFSDKMPELVEDILHGRVESFVDDIDANDPELQNYPYEVQAIVELHKRARRKEFENGFADLGVRQDFFWLDDLSQGRVHVHTNNVEKVQRYAERYGDVFDVLVVDMRLEIQALRGKKKKVWIVTDGVELPWNIMKDGVYSVPFELDFPEGAEMEGDIYSKILRAKTNPITAQPPPEAFRERIEEKALKIAEEVFVITISSKLSGSYNSALQSVAELNEEMQKRVLVFDSGQASCGQALMVHKAMEMAQARKGMLEILGAMNELKHRIKLFGLARDIEYLIRGGRLKQGSVKARFASLFQKLGFRLKLTLQNGEIRKAGFDFLPYFAAELTQTVVEFYKGKKKPCGKVRFAVSYAGDKEEAHKLYLMLHEFEVFKAVNGRWEVLFMEELNRVVGVHTGPALLVAWYEEWGD